MYQIETFTICDGWVNMWQDDDGTPVVFTTEVAALAELNEFLEDTKDAFDCGHLDSPYDSSDYRIAKLGAQS
jgi:hypothetical protein